MDWQTLIIQLGISGATLFVLREYLQRTDKRIDARDKTFIDFVNENNRKVTEIIIEAKNNIAKSTEMLCKVSKQFEKIIEKQNGK